MLRRGFLTAGAGCAAVGARQYWLAATYADGASGGVQMPPALWAGAETLRHVAFNTAHHVAVWAQERALAATIKDGDGKIDTRKTIVHGAGKTKEAAQKVNAMIPWDDLHGMATQTTATVKHLNKLRHCPEAMYRQVHEILIVATECIIEGDQGKNAARMLQKVPAPVRPLLCGRPIDAIAKEYVAGCRGDRAAACDKYFADRQEVAGYATVRKAINLAPGGVAVTAIIDKVFEIRLTAFAAAAYKWNVHDKATQSKVLGCVSFADLEQAELKSRQHSSASDGADGARQAAKQLAERVIMLLNGSNTASLDKAKIVFQDGPPPPQRSSFLKGTGLLAAAGSVIWCCMQAR